MLAAVMASPDWRLSSAIQWPPGGLRTGDVTNRIASSRLAWDECLSDVINSSPRPRQFLGKRLSEQPAAQSRRIVAYAKTVHDEVMFPAKPFVCAMNQL